MLANSWCLASKRRPAYYFSTGNLLILGLVTAIGVPASFLTVFLDEQTSQARRFWQEMKVTSAQRIVQRLCDIGSARPLGQRAASDGTLGGRVDVTPRHALADLKLSVQFLEAKIDRLTTMELTDRQVLELASCYIALDRLQEAVAAIEPLGQRDPRAALRLADLYRQLGRKQECQAAAERVLQLAQRTHLDDDIQAMENVQFGAYETLVVLAGERADYATAERLLREALEHLPGRRADVHGYLTKHFEFTGDFSQAIAHQKEAADADPERYSPPEALWRQVLSHGAPVGLARPNSSRYR
jgi:hypothetical protein